MWNSDGIMFKHRSAGVISSDSAMFAAEAVRLACVSGTRFGAPVVPEEVWRINATSLPSAAGAATGEPEELTRSRSAKLGTLGFRARRQLPRPRGMNHR